MNRIRSHAPRALLPLADALLGAAALCLAVWLYDLLIDPVAHSAFANLRLYAWTPAAYIATTLLCSTLLSCYSALWRRAGVYEIIRLTGAHLISAAAWILIKSVFTLPFSGMVSVIFFFLHYLLALAVRLIPRAVSMLRLRRLGARPGEHRALIIGCGDTGVSLAELLAAKDDALRPVGFLDDNPALRGTTVGGLRVLGADADLERAVRDTAADTVIAAVPSMNPAVLRSLFERTEALGAHLQVWRGLDDYDTAAARRGAAVRDIRIEDLLARGPVTFDSQPVREMVAGQVALVTGGAGSIGSELCRQLLRFGVEKLIIFDFSENGLFYIDQELRPEWEGRYETVLGSIRDRARLAEVFERFHPAVVFHAAAHKHVPMMEINPEEAVKNNVFGTKNVLEQCIASRVKRCVLISSDKAVNSCNVMGATKHIAELLFMEYNRAGVTEMSAVRFGNVLGSSGSIVPTFRAQIEKGGPVTVTDRAATRYFMTIPEAVSLVLQAGALAKGGEIFVLDMGQPVRIYDLACDMIRLAGLRPEVDIPITFIGLRPGDKLFEKLSLADESVDKTAHEKIFVCHDQPYDPAVLYDGLQQLWLAVEADDEAEAVRLVYRITPSQYPYPEGGKA